MTRTLLIRALGTLIFGVVVAALAAAADKHAGAGGMPPGPVAGEPNVAPQTVQRPGRAASRPAGPRRTCPRAASARRRAGAVARRRNTQPLVERSAGQHRSHQRRATRTCT